MRRLALVALFAHACSERAPVVAPPGSVEPPPRRSEAKAESSCPPWMEAWAAGEGLALGACRGLQLDDDARDEPVAQACRDDGHAAVYLVDDAQGRWAIEHEGWGHVPVCDPTAHPERANGLRLEDTGPGDVETRMVALRDGRPAIVGIERSSVRDVPLRVREVWDFDRARLHRVIEATPEACARPGPLDVEAALLVVGGAEIEAEWILAGEASHHGPTDGRLRARAEASETGRVRVRVEVSDDERIAARAGRAAASADAVVLRWASPSAAAIDPLGCEGAAITELRITAGSTGAPSVSGPGAAAAVIAGDLDALAIELDPRALGLDAVPWQLPLSIELVDVDREGTASLATSRFVADRPGSLGVLARHPGDRPHPPIGSAVR